MASEQSAPVGSSHPAQVVTVLDPSLDVGFLSLVRSGGGLFIGPECGVW